MTDLFKIFILLMFILQDPILITIGLTYQFLHNLIILALVINSSLDFKYFIFINQFLIFNAFGFGYYL